MFSLAANVSTFAANVSSFWPNVFSFGAEVFSLRRGGIQIGGGRMTSDRQAPRRHARSESLRCSRIQSRPASRAGHWRSSPVLLVYGSRRFQESSD